MQKRNTINISEAASDFFKQNLDPAKLSDRINQVKRTRDLAREAADSAEANGNAEAAAKLRADADMLQQLLDDTAEGGNITSNNDEASSTNGSNDAESEGSSSDRDLDSNDSDQTGNSSGNNKSSDDEDDEEDDEEDFDDEADEDFEDDDEGLDSDDSEEDEDGSETSGEDDSDEDSDEDSDNETDASGNSEDEDEDNDEDEDEKETSGTSTGDGEDSGSEDEKEAEDEEEDDSYGRPKVKDKKILQNPFKSAQIPTKLPKDLQASLDAGELEIESEVDAIVRILSKLTGEARRGAEQALRDAFKNKNSWGEEIDDSN